MWNPGSCLLLWGTVIYACTLNESEGSHLMVQACTFMKEKDKWPIKKYTYSCMSSKLKVTFCIINVVTCPCCMIPEMVFLCTVYGAASDKKKVQCPYLTPGVSSWTLYHFHTKHTLCVANPTVPSRLWERSGLPLEVFVYRNVFEPGEAPESPLAYTSCLTNVA